MAKAHFARLISRFLKVKPFEGEGEGDKGKKKEEGKKDEPKFKTVEEATAAWEKSEKEKRDLLHETMERKDKLRKLETEKSEAEAAQLKEQGKFKELYEATTPKVKRLESLEPVLNELYDLEIADVPEDKRDLIPAFDTVEQKLKWVKQAKAKNLFGEPGKKEEKKPPVGSDSGKPNTDKNLPEFVSWDANDPRLSSLNLNDYQIWKKHNRAPSRGVAGWGGKA